MIQSQLKTNESLRYTELLNFRCEDGHTPRCSAVDTSFLHSRRRAWLLQHMLAVNLGYLITRHTLPCMQIVARLTVVGAECFVLDVCSLYHSWEMIVLQWQTIRHTSITCELVVNQCSDVVSMSRVLIRHALTPHRSTLLTSLSLSEPLLGCLWPHCTYSLHLLSP